MCTISPVSWDFLQYWLSVEIIYGLLNALLPNSVIEFNSDSSWRQHSDLPLSLACRLLGVGAKTF